jgi:hypothetical protein
MCLVLHALFIFEIGSSVFACASLNHDPLIYVSHVAGMKGMCHHTSFSLHEMISNECFAQAGLELRSSLSLPPEWFPSPMTCSYAQVLPVAIA